MENLVNHKRSDPTNFHPPLPLLLLADRKHQLGYTYLEASFPACVTYETQAPNITHHLDGKRLCVSSCISLPLSHSPSILHKGSSLFEPPPFFRGNTPLCSQREESWFRDLWNLSRSIQRLLKYNACIVDWR